MKLPAHASDFFYVQYLTRANALQALSNGSPSCASSPSQSPGARVGCRTTMTPRTTLTDAGTRRRLRARGVDDPTTKHSGMSTSGARNVRSVDATRQTIPVMTMSLKNVTARSMRWRNSSASFSKVCNMLTWRHTATTPLAAIKSIPYTTFARPNRVHSMIPVTSFPVWISSRGQRMAAARMTQRDNSTILA